MWNPIPFTRSRISLTAGNLFRIFFISIALFTLLDLQAQPTIQVTASRRVVRAHVWLHKGVIPLLLASRLWTFPRGITGPKIEGAPPLRYPPPRGRPPVASFQCLIPIDGIEAQGTGQPPLHPPPRGWHHAVDHRIAYPVAPK